MGENTKIETIYWGCKQNRTIVRRLYQIYTICINILLRIVLDTASSIDIIAAGLLIISRKDC